MKEKMMTEDKTSYSDWYNNNRAYVNEEVVVKAVRDIVCWCSTDVSQLLNAYLVYVILQELRDADLELGPEAWEELWPRVDGILEKYKESGYN